MKKEICLTCVDSAKSYDKLPLGYLRSSIESTFMIDKSKTPTFCPWCVPVICNRLPQGDLDKLYEMYRKEFCVGDKNGNLFEPVTILQYDGEGIPPYCPFFKEHSGETYHRIDDKGAAYEL